MENTQNTNHDIIGAVKKFMLAAEHSIDVFSVRQAALYTGFQLEEMSEKIGWILGEDHPFVSEMKAYSAEFKRGTFDAQMEAAYEHGHELLDANFDIAWVSIGAVFSEGSDINGSFHEGTRSNLGKISENGKMMKDENGKVKKPEGWTPPNFKPFVCSEVKSED